MFPDCAEARRIDSDLAIYILWVVASILCLPFLYLIGTLRQHKYTRKKIHGADTKVDESEHFVFEIIMKPLLIIKHGHIRRSSLKREPQRITVVWRNMIMYTLVFCFVGIAVRRCFLWAEATLHRHIPVGLTIKEVWRDLRRDWGWID